MKQFFRRGGALLLAGSLMVSSVACRQAETVVAPSHRVVEPSGILESHMSDSKTQPNGLTGHESNATKLVSDFPIEDYNGLHIEEVHKTLVGKIDRFGFLMAPGTSDGLMYYDFKDTNLVMTLFISKSHIVTAIDFGYHWPTGGSFELNGLPGPIKKIEIIR